jgi:hypothetical protein
LKNVLVEYSEGIQTLGGVVLCNAIQAADDDVNTGNLLFVEGFPVIVDTGFNNIKNITP